MQTDTADSLTKPHLALWIVGVVVVVWAVVEFLQRWEVARPKVRPNPSAEASRSGIGRTGLQLNTEAVSG